MRRTRRRNTFLKRIVLGFAVVALMAPAAAQARLDISTGQGTTDHRAGSQIGYVAGVTDFPKAVDASNEVVNNGYVAGVTDFPRAQVSAPVAVASPGFDWGDAGIGAALALGLVLLAGGAVVTSRHLQKPQTA